MSINWPPLAQGPCYKFTLTAFFNGVDPRTLRVHNTSVQDPKQPTEKMVAPGVEDGTFIRIQPIYQQDEEALLRIEMTRAQYHEGNEPKDPASLKDVMRRANSFFGKECQVQIAGEYFISQAETPKILKTAYGPFILPKTKALCANAVGYAGLQGSPVQQITWALRGDRMWKIMLSGWQKGTFSPDTVSGAATDFNEVFNDFISPEVSSD